MRTTKGWRHGAVGLALALGISTAAFAQQQQQEGLVNVSLTNVANDIARDLSIDVSQVPVSVQAPIGVAANVCGVDANVLAKQAKSGDAACDAKSTSQALNQIVQRKLEGK